MGYVLSSLCFDWQALCLLVLLPNMNVQAFNNRHDHNKQIKVNSRLGNICSESSMWHHRCSIPVFLMGKTWNVFWCQMRTDVPRNYITTQPGCGTWEGLEKPSSTCASCLKAPSYMMMAHHAFIATRHCSVQGAYSMWNMSVSQAAVLCCWWGVVVVRVKIKYTPTPGKKKRE